MSRRLLLCLLLCLITLGLLTLVNLRGTRESGIVFGLPTYLFTVSLLALATAADNPPFQFTTKRADDRVTAKAEKGRTVIDITSPRGISQVVIERTG